MFIFKFINYFSCFNYVIKDLHDVNTIQSEDILFLDKTWSGDANVFNQP